MNLYDLGHVPWLDSQLIYHALPRLGMEGLILLAPTTPYVCIGYHQDAQQDVDLEFCQANDIPVFRREVGGGGVYLDGNQLFYQLVIHRDNPAVPASKDAFYRTLLAPVVNAYRTLGVETRYKPVNDIITSEGRKISGNGAADMGDYHVLVGNLIADFDFEMMARVLRVPDEKYRDKVYKSLRENLSTLRRELGRVPSWEEMTAALVPEFERVLGPLTPAPLPPAVRDKVAELANTHTTNEWLCRHDRRQNGRQVKIAAGVHIVQKMHKAPGGLIKAITEHKDGQIVSASISGDFFFYPAERLADLETALVGVPLNRVEEAIAHFYRAHNIESPGVTPADFAQVLHSK